MKRFVCFGICLCGLFVFATLAFSGSTESKQEQAMTWAQRFYGKEVRIDHGVPYCGSDGKTAVYVFTVLRDIKINPSPSDILVQISQARNTRLAGDSLLAEGRAQNSPEKIAQAYTLIEAGWAAMRDDQTYATIVMNADTAKPYPMKFYGGLSPHYVSIIDAKTIGRQRLNSEDVEITRYLYGGLFEFFVELKNGDQRTIVDLGELKNSVLPVDTLLTLFPPTTEPLQNQALSGFNVLNPPVLQKPPEEFTYILPGVPDYQTIRPRGCGPTASGCVLGYWDDHGYDRMVDGGDSDHAGYECFDGYWTLIWCELGPDMYYDPAYGVYISDVDLGIRSVANNRNLYSFDVSNEMTFTLARDDRSTFHREVDEGFPVVYMVRPRNFAGYHAVSGVGFHIVYGTEDDICWRIVHDNSPTTGVDVYYAEADLEYYSAATFIVTVHPGGSAPKMANADDTPSTAALSLAAYPNPFNPATTISYNLVEESEVSLGIFNAFGQLIRRFDFGSQEARRYTVVWDGSNQQGEKVGSGIYFLELKASEHRLVRRLSLLK